MSYVIHYVDPAQGSGSRVLPMKFADKEVALDNARMLRRSGFRISRVEGPHFEVSGAAVEAISARSV
ncbi:MAG TPA: hypothetical protein VMA53_25120 [Stellaceae bacterium]|nr:hypothetical protein [Stellaceae bacterium]